MARGPPMPPQRNVPSPRAWNGGQPSTSPTWPSRAGLTGRACRCAASSRSSASARLRLLQARPLKAAGDLARLGAGAAVELGHQLAHAAAPGRLEQIEERLAVVPVRRRAAAIDLAPPSELGGAPRPRQRIGAAQSFAQMDLDPGAAGAGAGLEGGQRIAVVLRPQLEPAPAGLQRPGGRPRRAPRRPPPAARCRARRGSAAAAAWRTPAAGGSRTAGRCRPVRPRSPVRRPRRTSRRPRAGPTRTVPPASSALSASSLSTSLGSRWTGTPAFWLRVESERNSVQSSRSNVNSGDFGRAGRLAETPARSGGFFNPRSRQCWLLSHPTQPCADHKAWCRAAGPSPARAR